MFTPITISFGVKMLSDTVRLWPGVHMKDVGMALGELCADSKVFGCGMLWQGVPE